MTPLSGVLVLVIILFCALFAAGCIGGDIIREQDLVIIKLDHTISPAWMKTIDSGKSDWIANVIQNLDGGYTISGGYSTPRCNGYYPATPTVIRLSNTGDILWKKDYSLGSSDPVTKSLDQISGIARNAENEYYLVSQSGIIEKLDPQGNILWKRNISSGEAENFDIHYPPYQAMDGSILIGGSVWKCLKNIDASRCGTGDRQHQPFVAKLDHDGNQLWFINISNTNFWSVISLNELPNNLGYMGQGQSNTGARPLFKLNKSGFVVNFSSNSSIADGYQMQVIPDGFSVFSLNKDMNKTIEEFSYTNDGIQTKTKLLMNISHNDAPPDRDLTLVTRDGNYLTINLVETGAGTKSSTTSVNARELNNGGELMETHLVTAFNKDIMYVHIRDLIETADGGYLLVLGVEKTQAC